MTSQVIVNIDTELKNKAMAMAKKEGLTMKALLSFLLKWYTDHSITLWARIERDYETEVEVIPWTEEELKFLEKDSTLWKLWEQMNDLLVKKGICKS